MAAAQLCVAIRNLDCRVVEEVLVEALDVAGLLREREREADEERKGEGGRDRESGRVG